MKINLPQMAVVVITIFIASSVSAPVSGTMLEAQTTSIPIQSIAWSPNGSEIAVGPGVYIAEDHDYSVQILNATTREIAQRLEFHSSAVNFLDWSPDGNLLVSSSLDSIGVVWDKTTGRIVTISSPYSMPGRFADIWSPDGSQIANISDGNSSINLWDPSNGNTLLAFSTRGTGTPRSIDWNSDGSQLVTGNRGGKVVIWDSITGQREMALEGHEGMVSSVDWSPDGSRIASGGWDDTVRIWDAVSGSLLLTLQGHISDIEKVSWNPLTNRLASASGDETVRVWDADTGEQLEVFMYPGAVYAVDWSPDGRRLAYGGARDDGQNGIVEIVELSPSSTPPTLTPVR